METIYWTMKNGQKIDVDTMDLQHLRNTLKMLIKAKKAQSTPKSFKMNGEIAQDHIDQGYLNEQEEEFDERYGI
jgi:hypothetical protein